VDELLNVWDVADEQTPADREDATAGAAYSHKINVLTWYIDHYLPNVAGIEYFRLHIRPFKFMTDLGAIVEGKNKVFVTITSEAFGLLVFENCRNKWLADLEYKKIHGARANVPKYVKDDPSTHKYVNKWSSSNAGSGL
jgi:hypothetical protein